MEFDPDRPLISQFRLNLPLDALDLVVIREMLDADWTNTHSAYLSLTFREVLETAAGWRRGEMSVDAVDFIIALFERSVLSSALREMNLRDFGALKPDTVGKVNESGGVDKPRGAELLTRLPDKLPLTKEEQADRLIDAMVLASECSLPPTETLHLCRATKGLVVPSAEGARGEAKHRHYRDLIARLEASALASIGKKVGDRSQKSFRPWHLDLLRALRDVAAFETPSNAVIAWERQLAQRHQIRAKLLGMASPFWQAMLESLLDRPAVDERQRDRDDRLAFAPLQLFDTAQRHIMLEELRAVLKCFDVNDIGMASRADGMISINVPFGNFQRRLLQECLRIIELSDTERDTYLAPSPLTFDIGGFAELVGELKADRLFLRRGLFGQALKGRRFDEARTMAEKWLAVAPPSALRESLRAFDFDSPKISDWSLFEQFLEKPTNVAIGLDFSGHIGQIANADQLVPFETNSYSRHAFPEGRLDVSLIEAHANYPYPWQGQFEDIGAGTPISGLAPLLIGLVAFRTECQGNRPQDLTSYHEVMLELAEAYVFLVVNRLIARELVTRSFSRSVPVIVGTHDFGNVDPVVHLAR